MKNNKTMRILSVIALVLCLFVLLGVTAFAANENTNVAKIGDTEYATLKAAMDEANKAAGDYTITLLKDSAEVFTFAQKSGVNITIDGNQNTFAGKITLNAGGGNLTFIDAKIAPANSQTIYLNASTAPNVTFDGCTLQGANKSGTIVYGYASNTSNTVTVKNCTADNLTYIVSCRQTGPKVVVIEKVTATNMTYVVRTLKCPDVTLKNVIVADAAVGVEIKNDAAGGKLTLENVNINIVTYSGSLYAPVRDFKGAGKAWTVYLKGNNTFSANGVAYEDNSWLSGNAGYQIVDANVAQIGEKKFAEFDAAFAAATSGDTIKLLADYTGEAITLPEGVKLDANGKNGADKITVVVPAYVAMIGETGYKTLEAAMTEANKAAGDYTITLLADNAEVFTFAQKSGVNITIDGEGKTFTGKITLNAGDGTLTITDMTITPSNADAKSIVLNAATAPDVIIDGCTMKNTGTKGAIVWGQASSTNNKVVIKNSTASNLQYLVGTNQAGCVDVTVENVTATNMAYLLRPMKADKVTVKNVTYSGLTFVQVKNSNVGTLAIENVTVTTTQAGMPPVTMLAPDSGTATAKYTITLKGENYANGAEMLTTNEAAWFATAAAGLIYEIVDLNGLNGSGTEADPYQIGSVKDLIKFRDSVNAGETKYSAPGVYVVLTADIDMAGVNWVGIGSATADHGFMGNFDGKGYKFMNLTINNPAADADGYVYAGLFSITEGIDKDNQNVIKNIIIENVTISTDGHIVSAAIAYPYYTIVENITVRGDINITGGKYTAGVLGYTRRCVNASNLTVSGNAGSTITGTATVGGVISDIQMNGGLTANYSNFSISNVAVTGEKAVGAISGIISGQTVTKITVENVDAVVFGVIGNPATIKDVTANGTLIGGSYGTGAAVEAKIGDTYYATFKAAYAAAKDGDTIIVLTTVKVTEDLILDRDITVKAAATCKYDIFDVREGATLTIDAGTFDSTASPEGYLIYIGNHNATRTGNVVINGGTFNANCTVVYVACGSLTINGGNFSISENSNYDYKYVINCYDNNYTTGNVVINGGTFAKFNPANNVAEGTNTNFCTAGAVVKSGDNYTVYKTFADAYAAAQAGEVIILATDITASEIITIDKAITLDGNGKTLTSTAGRAINVSGADGVTIKNLTIDASGERAINVIQNATNVTIDNVIATAANYTVNVASSAPNAVVAITNSNLTGLNVVNVAAAGADVTIDNTTITTVDNNANEGYSSICLNKDGVNGKIVATNTTVNITGSNTNASKIAKNGAKGGYISINGSTDGVVVDVAYISYGTTYYGFATLEAAIAKAQAGETITLIRDVKINTIGDLDVTGLTIDLNGNKLTIAHGGANTKFIGTNFTIKNGTIDSQGSQKTLWIGDTNATTANVTISGITVYGAIAVQNATNVTLENNNVTGNNYYAVYVDVNASVAIVSGHYEKGDNGHAIGKADTDTSTIAISGGTFSCVVLEEYCAEGYIPATIDGKHTVKLGKFVAQVGETKYESLAAAIAAAKAGETVTLVTDINENVTINKNIIIDGAGKTYTGTMTINNVTVTIENVNFVKGQVYKHKSTGSAAKVTIKNCDFDGQGLNAYAINLGGTNSIVIENVTAKDYGYGLLQVPSSCAGLTIKNVTVTGCYYGFKVDYANAVTMENVKVDANIGIYDSNFGDKTYTITNSTISSIDIWERSAAKTTTFKFVGVNEVTNLSTSAYAKYVGAQVGTKIYESLADAFAAAQNGNTVTLLSDITLTDADIQTVGSYKVMLNVEGKNITLDMNGKAITVNYNGTSYKDLVAIIRVADGAGLTVTGNGTIDVPTNGINIAYMFWKAGTTGYLTIENGTYHMDNSADSMVYTNGHEIVTVKGGNWTLDNVGTRPNRFPCFFNTQGAGDYSIIITGGTYNDDINHQHWGSEAVVDKTCYVVDNGNGTWTVKSGAVAYVNLGTLAGPYFVAKDFGFATFEEAWAAAGNGNTITLLQDVTINEALVNTKQITLDLNGKTITGTDNATGSFGLITNKGTLTITGNGTITLTATNNRGWNAYSSVISNTVGGKLIVENGTIEHLGGTDMAYAIDNLTNGKGTYAETIINGGTIKSTYRAIRMFLNGVEAQNILTVNGGTIEGTNKSIWMQDPSANANTGKLTVTKDATLNGDVYLTVTAGSTEWPVEVSIAASAVNGEVLTNANVPAGYMLEENEGIYSVERYVAVIGGQYYFKTLEEAVAKAQNKNVIVLLRDCEGNGIVIDKDITIDFNGFTYTFSDSAVGSTGTKTLGFQILKDNTVELKNGTLKVADSASDKYAMLIQNYANLKIRNMTLDGTNLDRSATLSYVVSINSGRVYFIGNVNITTNNRDNASDVGIDVYDYSKYYELPIVDIPDTVLIDGMKPADAAKAGKLLAVARAGKVYYATLQQAIDNSRSISLVRDVEGPGVVISQDVNINLGGFTYTVNSGVGSTGTKTLGFQILKGTKVGISNGKIAVAESASDKLAILIQNYGDLNTSGGLVLDGTNLDRHAYSYTLSINSGNVKLMGTTVIANTRGNAEDIAIDVYDYSYAGYERPVVSIYSTTTYTEGKLLAAAKYGNYHYSRLQDCIDKHGTATLVCDFAGPGVVFNKNATINFNGYTYTFTSGVGSTGTESNGFQILKGNRVTLNNGTLKVADSAADKFYILVQNYGDLTLNSMILDGTNLDKWSKTDGDSYTLSINSGNVNINNQSKIIANNDGELAYAFDVCDKTAWGYDLPKVKVAATVTIEGNIEAAVKIGVNYYATLAQAIADRDNASSKDEIVLMGNIVLKETLTIEASKAIVLDLNGYTISQEKACTGHYAMIVNKAILTIKDSVGGGKISFTDTGAGDPTFGWGSYTIVNEKNLYVNGGTIENLSAQNANGSVKHMYCAIQQNNTNAQLQVNGGTVSTPSYRSIRINAGSLTFGAWATTEEGATIEGQVWIQPFADGIKVNVNNGKFSPAGVDSSSIYVDNSSKTVALRINGGAFETKIGCANADALKGAIRAGSFTEGAIANTNAALFHKNFENKTETEEA